MDLQHFEKHFVSWLVNEQFLDFRTYCHNFQAPHNIVGLQIFADKICLMKHLRNNFEEHFELALKVPIE